MKDRSKEVLKLPKIKEIPGWRIDTKSPTLTLQPIVLHPFTVKSKKEVNLSPRYPKDLKLPRIFSPAVVSRGEEAEKYQLESSLYELNLPNIRSSLVYSAFSRRSPSRSSMSQSSFNDLNLQVPSNVFSEVSPFSSPQPKTHSRKTSNNKTSLDQDSEKSDSNEKIQDFAEEKMMKIEKIFDINSLEPSQDLGFQITEKIVSFDQKSKKFLNFSDKNDLKSENTEKPFHLHKNHDKRKKNLSHEEDPEVILNQVEKIAIPRQVKHQKGHALEVLNETKPVQKSSKNNTFSLSHNHDPEDSLGDTFRITDEECSEVQLGKIHYEVLRPFVKVRETSRISEGLVLEKKLLMKKTSFQLIHSKNNLTYFDELDDFHSMTNSKTVSSVTLNENSRSLYDQRQRRINSVPCFKLNSQDFSDDSLEDELVYKYSQKFNKKPEEVKAEANSNASLSQNLEKDDSCLIEFPIKNNPGPVEHEKMIESRSVLENYEQNENLSPKISPDEQGATQMLEKPEKLNKTKKTQNESKKKPKINKQINKNKSPVVLKNKKINEKVIGTNKTLKKKPLNQDKVKIKPSTSSKKILESSIKTPKNQVENLAATSDQEEENDSNNAADEILKKEKAVESTLKQSILEESSSSQTLDNISIIKSKPSLIARSTKTLKKASSKVSSTPKPMKSIPKLSYSRAADLNSSLNSIINEIKSDPIKTFIYNFSVSLLETINTFARTAKKFPNKQKVKKLMKNPENTLKSTEKPVKSIEKSLKSNQKSSKIPEKGKKNQIEKSQTVTPSISPSEKLTLSFNEEKIHTSVTASPELKNPVKSTQKSFKPIQNQFSFLSNKAEIYSKYSSSSQNYVKKSEINLPKLETFNSFKRKEDSSSISSSSSESLEQDSYSEESLQEESSYESWNIDDRVKSSAIYELNNFELVKNMAKSIFESNNLSKTYRPSDTFTKNISDLGENLYSVVEIDESKSRDQENPLQEISKEDLNIFGDRSLDQLIFFKDEKAQLVLNFKEKAKVVRFEDETSSDLQDQVKTKEKFLKNQEDKQKFTIAEYAVLQILPTEEFITEKLNLTEHPKFGLVDKSLKKKLIKK